MGQLPFSAAWESLLAPTMFGIQLEAADLCLAMTFQAYRK